MPDEIGQQSDDADKDPLQDDVESDAARKNPPVQIRLLTGVGWPSV